jgi:glycine oxidase
LHISRKCPRAALFWKLLSEEHTHTVAVIGAGIIGATIAWRLAQRGIDVELFDAGDFAGEASTAGAGMLAPGGEITSLAPWASDTVASRQLYPSFVQELAEASGRAIDLRECGAVDVAMDDEEWAKLLQRKAVLAQLGVATEEISAGQARKLAPVLASGDFRALWCPGDGVVSALDIKEALACLLPLMGVRIREHCPVAACTWVGSGFRLRAPDGASLGHARTAVIAAGAWATSFEWPRDHSEEGVSTRDAFPIRGHLVSAPHSPGTLLPIVRRGHLYVFQRTNGAVLAGSNEEHVGFDRTPNQTAIDALIAKTRELMPSLFPAGADVSWLGFRPGITGSGPEVRRMAGLPLWLAYGHYRNGILLAPHTAAWVAGDILRALDDRPGDDASEGS